jgi:hypothetical protein
MDIPRESAKRHSVILELKNPELEQAALDAEWQLRTVGSQAIVSGDLAIG